MDECDSRRERKKTETRQRLLEAAWQLFQDRGYEHTTVAEITEAADVGKGTFFNYFPTKEEIVDEIALWRIDLLGSHVLGEGDVPRSALARIKLLIKAMADEFSPEQELARQVFLARVGAHFKHESAHRIGSLMHELVRQGQASGEIRDDVDQGLVSRLLMTCLFHYMLRGWHHDIEFSEEAKLMDVVDALMEGLGGERRAS
jgi:AcrR family transcriptional regulator